MSDGGSCHYCRRSHDRCECPEPAEAPLLVPATELASIRAERDRLKARWEELRSEIRCFAGQSDRGVDTYRLGAKSMASKMLQFMTDLETRKDPA